MKSIRNSIHFVPEKLPVCIQNRPKSIVLTYYITRYLVVELFVNEFVQGNTTKPISAAKQ